MGKCLSSGGKSATTVTAASFRRSLRQKKLPLLAMFPIGICLMFWFYVASLPIMIPTIMLIIVYGDIPLVAHAGLALPSLALVFLITPWFFGWYITAASLMFGRSSRAQKKEQALIAAIQAYKTKAI